MIDPMTEKQTQENPAETSASLHTPVKNNGFLIGCVIVFLLVALAPSIRGSIISLLPSKTPSQVTNISDQAHCQAHQEIYGTSLQEVLKNPGNVCLMNIGANENLEWLPTVSKSLTNIEGLVIETIEEAQLPAAIGDLQTLKEFQLREIESETVIPPEIGKLTNLTYLKIMASVFETIPSEIGNLQNLEYLFIAGNEDLISIPLSVSKLTRLTSVTIGDNHPDIRVPESIVGHKNLETIIINETGATKLPLAIYDLQHLRTLDYTNNKIATIPAILTKNAELRILKLGSNQLTEFPDVRTLANLEVLELSNNQLREIPRGVEHLKKLKTLHLSNINIDDADTDIIQQLSELISLDLGNNNLTKLPQGIEGLKKLRYIRLAGNKIDTNSLNALKRAFPQAILFL